MSFISKHTLILKQIAKDQSYIALLHTLILTMCKITSNDYQLIYYIKHDEINAHTFLAYKID